MKKLFFLILILTSINANAYTCRNATVKRHFDQHNNGGKSKPGYKVDRICSLFCGGIDAESNMQYQTFLESDAKDRWENTKEGCTRTCNSANSTLTRQVFNCK